MKRKFWIVAALGLAAIVPSTFAASVPLAPGTGTPVLFDNGNLPASGLVASGSFTVTNTFNPNETATALERVYNVGGLLDFFYQITNTSPAPPTGDSFNEVVLDFFKPYFTAVAYDSNGSLVNTKPQNGALLGNVVTRSLGGDSLNFFFILAAGGDGALVPGATTDWLEIDTSAQTFDTKGTISVADGGVAITGGAFEPAGPSVPEPMTMGLFGGGLALLGVARWRRSRNK